MRLLFSNWGKSSKAVWLLSVLFIILGAISAYLLTKLYHATNLFWESNLKSFIQKADYQSLLLHEFLVQRINDLKEIELSPSFKALLSYEKNQVKAQYDFNQLIARVESDFNRILGSINESNSNVFFGIVYLDPKRHEIVARAPKNYTLPAFAEPFFEQLEAKAYEKPKLFVKCNQNGLSAFIVDQVLYEGSNKGFVLAQLGLKPFLSKIKTDRSKDTGESPWILDRNGTVIVGPESIIGLGVSEIFGIPLESFARVKTVSPVKAYQGIFGGPTLVLKRNLNIGGLSLLAIAPEQVYASAPSFRFWGLLVVCLLGGLGLMLAYIYRTFYIQNSMNLELQEARKLLETRVHERTLELKNTNEMLACEVKDRKKSQETLYQQAQILASITDAILIISIDKKIIFANTTACELFGVGDEQSIIGRDCKEILKHVRDMCDDCLIDLMISEQKPYKKVAVWLDKNGKELWVYNTMFPYHDDQGGLLGAIVLSTDYSAQKEIEIALNRAKEHAEAASKAKSDFLARMSHEIRTPMYGILGTLELVLDGELKAEQRDLLLTAKFSAEALQGILNDILDFSKIEARKIDLEEKIFSPLAVVESVLETLAVKAQEKALELIGDVKSDIPSALIGDPFRLRQILLNLVGNAVKFTNQGEIVISVFRKQRLGNELWLEFVVSDTGIGVNPDKLKTIFDPFAQAEGFISRTFGGTGLGLAISSTLENIMGGKLWADSVPGKGSSFHFSIPLKGADDIKPLEEEYCIGSGDPPRVLVVDDNPTNRRILVENIARWGFRVDDSVDAEHALLKLSEAISNQHPYQLILLDQCLPGMSGLELLHQIDDAANTKTILLSSSADLKDREEAEGLGVSGFLMKPIKQADLKKTVFEALCMVVKSSQEDPSPAAHDKSGSVSKLGLKVLLAEDNKVNQKLIKKVLEKVGYEVTIADNGIHAVRAVTEGNFDLVLMDIQMPEMDGLTATRLIRRHEERYGKHIPIFAMTAHAYQEAEQMCRQSGMDGYLTKPISGAKLTKILAKVFAGKHPKHTTSSA